jgi:hypothetical protein
MLLLDCVSVSDVDQGMESSVTNSETQLCELSVDEVIQISGVFVLEQVLEVIVNNVESGVLAEEIVHRVEALDDRVVPLIQGSALGVELQNVPVGVSLDVIDW